MNNETEQDQKPVYPTIPDAKGYFFKTADDEKEGIKSRNYPTPPDEDGFYFKDADDDIMQIATKNYDNGNIVNRVILKDGRKAIVRELKAWEVEETQRFHKNNQDLMLMAIAAKAVKIDDKNVAFEDVKNMRSPDWISIKGAVALLNFS